MSEINPECINLYDENGKETSLQDRIYRTDKISVAITTSFRPFYLVREDMEEEKDIKQIDLNNEKINFLPFDGGGA